jgi:hypothetical protein
LLDGAARTRLGFVAVTRAWALDWSGRGRLPQPPHVPVDALAATRRWADYVLSNTVRDPGTPTLCVHTNEHRAAAIQITAVEKDSIGYMAQISADVTVWELA